MVNQANDDNRLARAVQDAFPLVDDPYFALADQLGLSEAFVLERLLAWQEDGRLREVSAVLEGSALGYDSALVAAVVPPEQLERVGPIFNQHPTITHNYVREHHYNLWFTIAVPHEMGLERTLGHLERLTGIAPLLPLRRTATFKIGVNFDLEQRRSDTARRELCEAASFSASDSDKRAFRALQTPLPLTSRPFESLAAAHGLTAQALLEFAERHMGGALRRYVATFRHRRLGVKGNGMTVWQVPAERRAEVGGLLAAAPEVSHCYARNPIPGFPYTVYSMIHGPDEAAVGEIVARLGRSIGADGHLVLFSTRELKKCRLRYFTPELDAWWAEAERQYAA